MLDFEQVFVPIEYANTYRTRFVIPFPEYVKPQQIGVNLSRLGRLLRIGGISHLRIVGQTEGETTRFTPTVVGYDSQGNAYAGKKGEQATVPEFTTLDDEANPNLDASAWRPHAATWTNAVINLNINEMVERIRQEDKWTRGVQSTEAWAHHLDEVLRKGVRDIGIRHLTLGLNKYNWGQAAFQYVFMGVTEVTMGPPSVETMASKILLVPGALNLMHFIRYGNTDDGFRWSVFYGPQLDRALLLKVLAGRKNLVRSFADTNSTNGYTSKSRKPLLV